MSESSLPPFGSARLRLFLRTLRSTRIRETLKRLRAKGRRDPGNAEPVRVPVGAQSRAEKTVREYLDAHAALLERAARLEEKVQRLERSGTPSESARNRAERAREEVAAGLAALRADFVEAVGERAGASAFDRAVGSLCPAFVSHRSPGGIS